MRTHGEVAPDVLLALDAFAAGHEVTEQVFLAIDGAGLRDYDIVAMDEYSLDLVVAWPGGAWHHEPTPAELLATRLVDGWRPTPSYLVGGPRVVGHAADVPCEQWTRPGESSCRVPRST